MRSTPLTQAQCHALLTGRRVGRVAFSDRAMPAVAPVPFALVDGDVVFPAGPWSRLAAGLHNTVVAFQVDDLDDAGVGRTVMVTGTARHVLDAAERARLAALLDVGQEQPAPAFVRVAMEVVTGYAVGPSAGSANIGPQR